MKLYSLFCVASVALAVLTVTEARSSRYYGRHQSRKYYDEEQPATRQIQQEEPKPVEIEPSQSSEVSEDSSVEKARPARARKAPVLCNANAAAANLDKPDKVETDSSASDKDSDDVDSWEVIEPESSESVEIKPLANPKPDISSAKAKKLEKPRGKVVPASEESSESVEEDEDDDSGNNFSAALASLEEPAPPKALSNDEIPMEQTPAVENNEQEERRPKARRSKHHRSDVRRIEKPHRRRVIFRDEDDE